MGERLRGLWNETRIHWSVFGFQGLEKWMRLNIELQAPAAVETTFVSQGLGRHVLGLS